MVNVVAVIAVSIIVWMIVGMTVTYGVMEWHIKWCYHDVLDSQKLYKNENQCKQLLLMLCWPITVVWIVVFRRNERFRFWTSKEYRAITKPLSWTQRQSFKRFMYDHYVLVLDRTGIRVPIKHLNLVYCRNRWASGLEDNPDD